MRRLGGVVAIGQVGCWRGHEAVVAVVVVVGVGIGIGGFVVVGKGVVVVWYRIVVAILVVVG